MGLNNINSDYGSGSSSSSSTTWLNQENWPSFQPQMRESERPRVQKSTSILDLAMGRCTLVDVMKEFSMNGFDSPYNPDDDVWAPQAQADKLSGFGPGSAYLRQKSWPAPERSPAQRLPRPASDWIPSVSAKEFVSSTPVNEVPDFTPPPQQTNCITEEQVRVLSSLPDSVLYPLLRGLEHARGAAGGQLERCNKKRQPDECRFCKNNGERESYYRSHQLKDGAGRVACPVLRAFVCRRCGARGDHAHTIKYCPLSTQEERMKSAAMMRSVRMASGRRRCSALSPAASLRGADPRHPRDPRLALGDACAALSGDSAPLDPVWAALEQKLML